MGEALKNRVILILGVLTALLFILTVSSCINSGKYKSVWNKEALSRLEAEERLSKFTQEKSACEAKIDKIIKDLQEEKAMHEATKKGLLQEQMINSSMKEELQKVTKSKESLEEQLKEALASGKSSKSKK